MSGAELEPGSSGVRQFKLSPDPAQPVREFLASPVAKLACADERSVRWPTSFKRAPMLPTSTTTLVTNPAPAFVTSPEFPLEGASESSDGDSIQTEVGAIEPQAAPELVPEPQAGPELVPLHDSTDEPTGSLAVGFMGHLWAALRGRG